MANYNQLGFTKLVVPFLEEIIRKFPSTHIRKRNHAFNKSTNTLLFVKGCMDDDSWYNLSKRTIQQLTDYCNNDSWDVYLIFLEGSPSVGRWCTLNYAHDSKFNKDWIYYPKRKLWKVHRRDLTDLQSFNSINQFCVQIE